MSLYSTLVGERWLDPPDRPALISWLLESPLSPGDRVSVKKEWEHLTGDRFTPAEFDRLRRAWEAAGP
jgi:hypothetical protein